MTYNCQRALNGLGQLRGWPWRTGAPQNCPNQGDIVAFGRIDVCDGGHRMIVMNKPGGSLQLSKQNLKIEAAMDTLGSRKARDLGQLDS
jgi:hypothetical protein